MAELPTIYALSSAPGRAGVAVIRISGVRARHVIDACAGPRPSPRVAAPRSIRHPGSGETLDRGIAVWFPGPKSFTGEDVVELQVHGGRAVVDAVLGALSLMPGLRPAEAGEFARRAFENGKVDLAEVEGIADLIDAETEAQRLQALAQATGALSSLYDGYRETIIEALGLIEAGIDFSDEGDVAERTFQDATAVVRGLAQAMRHHLDDGNRGEILRDGFRVVLAGAPNVGKSSLLNALAKRDAAIVSSEAGTTRDVIEVRLDLAGMPVIIADTAGLRDAQGAVEREGIRRSVEQARRADLVLWLIEPDAPREPMPADLAGLEDRTLLVMNKADLLADGVATVMPDDAIVLSVKTGAGLDELTRRLASIVAERIGFEGVPHLTRPRHRALVQSSLASLEAFLEGDAGAVELRAEDLRQAADALGRLTGRVDVEDVLDQIFSRFCIGK